MLRSLFPGIRSGILISLLGLFVAVAFTGCCPCPPKEKVINLPPPLTLEQRLGEFNHRARIISNINARGNVKLTWIEDGKSRTESADAKVRIRQRYGDDAVRNYGGDVLIFGTVALQPVFQVGKNPDDTWFLVRLDTKTAWTARTSSLAQGGKVGPYRADLMLDLLGITELPQQRTDEATVAFAPKYDLYVLQRYPEKSTKVELLVFKFDRNFNDAISRVRLQRCITLDRVTALPERVTTYDADGLPIIIATLSDYREAPLREGDKFRPDAVPPKLPYRVSIEYVRDATKVELSFDDMFVPTTLPPTVFETPDFGAEGLKVRPIGEAR